MPVATRHVDGDGGRSDRRKRPAEEVQRIRGLEELRAVVADDACRRLLDSGEVGPTRGANMHPDEVAGRECAGLDDGRDSRRPLEELGVRAVRKRLRDRRSEHGPKRGLVSALHGDRDAAVRRRRRQLAEERVADLRVPVAAAGECRAGREQRCRDRDDEEPGAHRMTSVSEHLVH